ncbi:MAG: metallophosphoesterase [Aphanothece sp. CMT-3BRIN-NPC111]|jgi:hypothetical protein|nr:metallophosphoesterase [Aphanothece sp. CMT-3BRIN-NPC111]
MHSFDARKSHVVKASFQKLSLTLFKPIPNLRLGLFSLGIGLLSFAPQPGATITPPNQRETPPASMWVEMGPDGMAIARAITPETTCPSLTLDSQLQPMQVRAAAQPPDYPVLVCELTIPSGTQSAAIAGQALPLPKSNPERILVIGDTGCRIKIRNNANQAGESKGEAQACNDPQAWPFNQIAKTAAAWEPDLVIHLGDYHYRESPCPAGNSSCAGSPWGYNWGAWNADFFTPAAPLLQAAPWVVIRGNHEDCNRAGAGWFRFLDPRPLPTSCKEYTLPYTVPAGNLRLLVLDTSKANDLKAPPDQVVAYSLLLAEINFLAGKNAWLLMHHPLWAVGHQGEVAGNEQLFRTNPTLQAASKNSLSPGIKLVLSGHMHLFEALSFADKRPPNIVVGNSGTQLDPPITSSLTGLPIAGTNIASGKTIHKFGYATVERAGSGWKMSIHDINGAVETICTIQGSSVDSAICTP